MDVSRICFDKYEIYTDYFGPSLEDGVRDFIYDLDKLVMTTLCANFPEIEFSFSLSLSIPSAAYTYYDVVIRSNKFDSSIDQEKAEEKNLGFVDSDYLTEFQFTICTRPNGRHHPCPCDSKIRYQLTLSSVGRPEITRAKFYAIKNSLDYSVDLSTGFNELKKKYSFIM